MKIKKIILLTIGLGLLLTVSARQVKAESCTTSYGRTTCITSQLVIVKDVENPITGGFVKNLSTLDATFSPNGDVSFRLTITNTGSTVLDSVTVKDIFPQFLSFENGPGTYDAANKTLTFTLNNLLAGESRQVQIRAKIDPSSAFPAGQNLFCTINDAQAQANGMTAEDTAQLCIRTNVLGATTLPVTGNNDWFLIFPFLGLAIFGLALARIKN